MYAIVKAGGRQEKVSVGETLVVDRLDAAVGAYRDWETTSIS